MWGLLKRFGSDCWSGHDWISKANRRGLWLECRRCGQETPGLELPSPRYRRTQEGVDEAHRLGGMAPALKAARASAAAAAELRRFTERRVAKRPAPSAPTSSWDALAPAPAVATTEAERAWLQAWRALSSDERVMAERLVAGLSLTRQGATRGVRPGDDGLRQDLKVG
ncbi:MAG: hypothetical protein ACR2LU_10285 [Luteitalea sp.]|nr:hypothetical protein [Acidobacteriota bacterium]